MPVVGGGGPTWRGELRFILSISPSLSLTFFLSFLMPIVDSIFIGRFIGEEALAAAALGATLYNMLWLCVVGAASAFDTIGSRVEGKRVAFVPLPIFFIIIIIDDHLTHLKY